MYCVVDKSNGTLISFLQDAVTPAGEWGDKVKSGAYALLQLPAGELLEDLKYDVPTNTIVADAVKKTARTDRDTKRAARLARLKASDATAGGLPELRIIIKDLIDQINGV